MSETQKTTPERRPFWRRRNVWVVGLALAVLGEYRRFPSEDERREAFQELATAALLQDLSRMADPEAPDEDHPDRSRQMVLELGLGMAVAALVLNVLIMRMARRQRVVGDLVAGYQALDRRAATSVVNDSDRDLQCPLQP